MVEQKSNRNPTIDIIRGIAILMVVLGHTMTGCTMNAENSFLYNVIWTLQMPLFILISGYVTKYSRTITSWNAYGRFAYKKTLAYLMTWTVWTFVVRGLIFKQTLYLNVKYILFNMDSGYWFLFTLWTIVMIYGFAQFFSERICTNKSKITKLLVLMIVYVFGMAILASIGFVMGLSFLSIKLTLYYMPFYFAGFLYGQFDVELGKCKHRSQIKEITIAVCFIVWITLMVRFNFYSIGEGISGIILRALTSMMGCIAVCGFISKFVENKPERKSSLGWVLLRNVGVHSLEIYLIHYLFLSMVKFDQTPNFDEPAGIMIVVLNYILTVCMAYGITRLINQNRLLDKVLFGKNR